MSKPPRDYKPSMTAGYLRHLLDAYDDATPVKIIDHKFETVTPKLIFHQLGDEDYLILMADEEGRDFDSWIPETKEERQARIGTTLKMPSENRYLHSDGRCCDNPECCDQPE